MYNKKDRLKKDLMNKLEVELIKLMTRHKDLDPMGAAAVLLKVALSVYHTQLQDKYALEEVIFHALETLDSNWFEDLTDMDMTNITIH
mgnify:FL=1